ncbi:MAG: enoyl-CoA hydratase [Gammaproteobacteria bacterium]|nr:enoyl-CoA hydratase [Gammaproteobacteria bacterium]MDE0227112.1 enoyl-CoA hydratase [Gammaproteobacteria bacterium]MDE0453650.1 enoyl-CoA hydratase [Gammaproteobacteria bacterium]
MELKLETQKMRAWIRDGVGWMEYNNPARRNAVSLEMWQAIGDIMGRFEQDPDVRVAVMRGAGGKAFVSGADISEFDAKRGNAKQMASYGAASARGSKALGTFSKPLIACIEGYCIGGGLAAALNADVRFATPDSLFGIPAAKLGLGYGYEGLAKLSRQVGPTAARDILLSARFLDAAEALRIGLINFIEERDAIRDAVAGYADRVAANAPLTLKAAKAAVDAWERGGRKEDLENVRRLVEACFDSDDYREGRRAFAEKRTPQFDGR